MPFSLKAAKRFRLSLRPVVDADLPFLEALYISTRTAEVAATGWSVAMQEAFLRQQHAAQHAHYQAHYAHAERRVLVKGDVSIGRLYWYETASDLHIVDIALLPSWRGQGIGAALLRDLGSFASARGKSLTIHVEKSNPARALYERLGFVAVEDRGIYDFMRRAVTAQIS